MSVLAKSAVQGARRLSAVQERLVIGRFVFFRWQDRRRCLFGVRSLADNAFPANNLQQVQPISTAGKGS